MSFDAKKVPGRRLDDIFLMTCQVCLVSAREKKEWSENWNFRARAEVPQSFAGASRRMFHGEQGQKLKKSQLQDSSFSNSGTSRESEYLLANDPS